MISPNEACIAGGAKFTCQINRRDSHHAGVVRDEHGEVRWRYCLRKNDLGRGWKNPFKTKDFVVANPRTGEELIFRRGSFFPSRFTILDARDEIGVVCLTSLLRNKYTINVKGRQPWTFRMPLFTVRFWGGTDQSPEFWVIVGPSKMEWNILIKPALEDQPLVASLSFIHHQWWNYS